MYEIMSTNDWSDIYQCMDPNAATEMLQQSLYRIFERTEPKKIIPTRRFPPWYSLDTINKIKEKERVHKNSKRYGDEASRTRFDSLRRTIKTQADNEYPNFILAAKSNILSDPSQLWNFIHSIKGISRLPGTYHTIANAAADGLRRYDEVENAVWWLLVV
ncbi:unnamed protein product [Acanthoscelides obtectus]|uniref:Uncharacterized protein n=1 Tax=Acanthoscelides obtectus TaxID=200917 RepID=A0A9P0LMD1_ACAOB|nr:unnamed protein product [Acanthoscelides obtectus]CAK1631736.1 hypothetical protein AOBTE_LOCUS7118 [Acanthoscelides obtectus]